MNRIWKACTMILVMSVLIGITMNFFLIFSHPGVRDLEISAAVMKTFRSFFPEDRSIKTQSRGVPVSEKDRKLRVSPDKVSQLRNMYSSTISDPMVQMQVIEQMEQYLTSEFPETWHGRMAQALGFVFPDKADQLVQMLRKLDDYNAWVDKNWGRLLGMKRTERNNVLWDKRKEIFGNAAQGIWQGDLKEDSIYRILEVLNKVKGSSLEDALDFLVNSIRQAYGGQADIFIKKHQKELLDTFLGLESIQSDFKVMQPPEKRQSLKTIRKAFGMSEAELIRWEALDRVRDERWAKGLAYVKERQRIAGYAQDSSKERMLDELRMKYFGPEAEIIANEERAGFFRFDVKRVYGKN
jgi:hypothetical protein